MTNEPISAPPGTPEAPAPMESAPVCASHADAPAQGTCARCGDFVCAACGSPCPACRRRAKAAPKTRIEPWQGGLALVIGGIAAQVAGAFVFLVAAILAVASTEGQPDFAQIAPSLLSNFWVVGPSIFFTGLSMVGIGVLTPLLARVKLRDALGLRGAPVVAFVAAPLGILALGPTSDAMRQLMVALAPGWTFGNLESLDAVARSAPLYLIVPAMALVPGVAEETLFRGMFQRSIQRPWLAITLSATLFAAYHMDPHHVVAVLPLGFYLAWLGHRTQSLFVPITAHVFNNAAAVIGSRLLGDAGVEPTPITEEWWWLPIGWALAGACVAAIVWATRRRVAEPDASAALATAPAPR